MDLKYWILLGLALGIIAIWSFIRSVEKKHVFYDAFNCEGCGNYVPPDQYFDRDLSIRMVFDDDCCDHCGAYINTDTNKGNN